MMNFDQLRIFVAVADRGHVTMAAKALGLSQSATSAAIKALEEANGVRLFNRVGRRIELSQAGTRFLPEAKAVLDRIAAARLVLDNISQTIAGSVSVAASQTIASYWLPKRLASFHEMYPPVRLDVSIGNTRQVEAWVLDGAVDIGLVEGRTRSDLLKRVTVDIDRLVLVTARSRGDVGKGTGALVDLSELRWIVRERGSGTREALEDLVAREGKSLQDLAVFLVLPSNEAVRQAVEAGGGATMISQLVVAQAIANGSVTVIPYDIPTREFVLISHRDRQPTLSQAALRSFLLDRQVCR